MNPAPADCGRYRNGEYLTRLTAQYTVDVGFVSGIEVMPDRKCHQS